MRTSFIFGTGLIELRPRVHYGSCRCLAMYISHAILFLQFYLDAFCKEYRSGEATFLTFFHAFAVIGLVKLVMHEQCWRLFADVRIGSRHSGFPCRCALHTV